MESLEVVGSHVGPRRSLSVRKVGTTSSVDGPFSDDVVSSDRIQEIAELVVSESIAAHHTLISQPPTPNPYANNSLLTSGGY